MAYRKIMLVKVQLLFLLLHGTPMTSCYALGNYRRPTFAKVLTADKCLARDTDLRLDDRGYVTLAPISSHSNLPKHKGPYFMEKSVIPFSSAKEIQSLRIVRKLASAEESGALYVGIKDQQEFTGIHTSAEESIGKELREKREVPCMHTSAEKQPFLAMHTLDKGRICKAVVPTEKTISYKLEEQKLVQDIYTAPEERVREMMEEHQQVSSNKLSALGRDGHKMKERLPVSGILESSKPQMFSNVRLFPVVGEDPIYNKADQETLINLLKYIIETDMKDCFLTFAFGSEYEGSTILKAMLTLPNSKQVVKVSSESDYSDMLWKSIQCRGYFFMQRQPDVLHAFSEWDDMIWDFDGRYVLIGLSDNDMKLLLKSRKIYKTKNMIGIKKYSRDGEWGIYTNWAVYMGSPVRVGTWKVNGFTARQTVLYPDKLKDFYGAPVRVALFEFWPFIIHHRDEDGNFMERYGQDVMVVRTLTEAVNGTLVFKEVSLSEMWGSESSNGSWTGMHGYVQRDEVEMGVCVVYITKKRMSVMQFTDPYVMLTNRVMMRKPEPLPKWKGILYPFTLTTWISIIMSLIFSGPLLYVLVQIGQASGGEKNDLNSLSYAYLYTVGIHFMEGQAIVPTRRSIQIFISFMWIYAVVITTGYNSNLTALLTVNRQPPTIDTFQELHDSNLELYGTGPTFKTALQVPGKPHLQALGNKLKSYRGRVKQTMDLMREGKVAFISSEPNLLYMKEMEFTYDEVTIMRFMKESFTSFHAAIGTPLGSPITKRLNVFVARIVEGGLVKYWFKNSLRRMKREAKEERKREANENKSSSDEIKNMEKLPGFLKILEAVGGGGGVTALALDHLEGFFFILVMGYIAAFFAFLLERRTGSRQMIL